MKSKPYKMLYFSLDRIYNRGVQEFSKVHLEKSFGKHDLAVGAECEMHVMYTLPTVSYDSLFLRNVADI